MLAVGRQARGCQGILWHFTPPINQETAKALGLTIPQSILIRADQVIQ